jgi:phenylacetate-CoA ligase
MNRHLVQHVVYPLHERLLHRPTFPYLRDLERTQWLQRDELEWLQTAKLKTLLQGAAAHCPWHARRIAEAEIRLTDDEPLSLDELRRLPVMTKADAKQHRDDMVWRDVPGGAFRYNTGGSSGEPLVFYYGRERQASDAAGRMRARRWWGVEVGDREVYLWGAPVELAKTDRIKTVRDRLFNQLVLNAFDMSVAHMDEYIDAIRAFKPTCLYGYASSVALLAARALETGADLCMPSLKVVCTTGEPLYPQQRRTIHQAFQVPVANEFGSRDIGFTAHESPDEQLLLMSESIILEVLDADGSPVAPGQTGEAVMTGLCSAAQPFIRYRTGDMVRLSEEPCKNGRGLHVVAEVLGRNTDFVVRSDGTVMHALAVIYVLRDFDAVGEFRFIQHAVDDVEILVVPTSAWDQNAERRIAAGIRARLGEQVRLAIRPVESIPPEASGKHRYVVSHVPLPGGLESGAASM